MCRFVILEHDYPEKHWDLMLEQGDILRTWRLSALPASDRSVIAIPSFDHRKIYLSYEGAISGGRGTVVQWDGGRYRRLEETNDRILLGLDGHKLRTMAVLERDSGESWNFRVIGPDEMESVSESP